MNNGTSTKKEAKGNGLAQFDACVRMRNDALNCRRGILFAKVIIDSIIFVF